MEGNAESLKARVIYSFSLARPEVPVPPERPKARKLTRSVPVKHRLLYVFSAKEANVKLALFSHPAPKCSHKNCDY